MQLICGTCSALHDASDEVDPRCGTCGACLQVALAPQRSAGGLPSESWLLRTELGESGPYAADDVARLMAEGACDWTTEVIREGLGAWRAARRDALLVVAVARARGLDGATLPVGSVRAPLHSDPHQLEDSGHHDTWVDARPSLPELQHTPNPAALPAAAPQVPGAPALPLSVAHVPAPAGPPTALGQRESTAQVALHRSATGLAAVLAAATDQASSDQGGLPGLRPKGRPSWLTPWVALVAFVAGVVFALLPSRLVELRQAVVQGLRLSGRRAAGAPVAGAVHQKAPSVELVRSPLSVPRRAVAPSMVGGLRPLGSVEFVRRSLPARSELRAELDRLSPLVRRCMRDPSGGVELDLVIVGMTGHVDEVRFGTPSLTPGAIECIREVFVDFYVAPFVTPELRLAQRYRW